MSLTTRPPSTARASEWTLPDAVRPVRRPNPRARARRRLLLAGLLPAGLAVAFAVEVGLTLDHNGDGRVAFADGDWGPARDEFGANTADPNLFETWVAPFDEGTAAFGAQQYDDAVVLFEAALEDVPGEQECLVRIDLALTHEQLGDAAAEGGDLDEATTQWQAGVDALSAGGCSDDAGTSARTEDSATTEQRLREKLEGGDGRQGQEGDQGQQGDNGGKGGQQGEKKGGQGGQDEQQGPKNRDKGQGEGDQGEPQDPKERRLDRQNGQGEDDRSENQDQDDYPGFGTDYAW